MQPAVFVQGARANRKGEEWEAASVGCSHIGMLR